MQRREADRERAADEPSTDQDDAVAHLVTVLDAELVEEL
jgi:hypothetical protein